MSLNDKYAKLIQYAQASGVQDLSITDQNNVLHISGKAVGAAKDRIWEIYNEIDPDMRSGDLVLNINVIPGTESDNEGEVEIYEVKPGDSLSKIATNYAGITWSEIFEANKDQLKDPDTIHPGQKLKIPKSK